MNWILILVKLENIMAKLMLTIGGVESLQQENSLHIPTSKAALFVSICKPKTFKLCSI